MKQTDLLPTLLVMLRNGEPARTSRAPTRERGETEGEVAQLMVAFECLRPHVPGARLSLTDVDEVVIGRGTRRQWSRANRQLLLAVPDLQMSRLHARLTYASRSWRLDDVGSKNGLCVNGLPQKRVVLADGDLIEMGHTLFVYRVGADRSRDAGDRDLAEETSLPEVFRTLSVDMERLAAALVPAAPTSAPVLLSGEGGTGKEVVARAIHALSGRPGPFVPAHCAALHLDRLVALIAEAEGGTLFLDSVDRLPAESQTALEALLSAVGSSSAQSTTNARVVASTGRDFLAPAPDGPFLPDLHALLAPTRVSIPPLRERPEDVGALLSFLLARLTDETDFSIHPRAARALLTYPYPRNGRELLQALHRALLLVPAGELGLEHLPPSIRRYG